MHGAAGGVEVEVRRRVQAAKEGWCQLKGVWHAKIPYKVKRRAFISKIQGALLAGMESYCLGEGHYKTLGTVMLRMMRSLKRGTATPRKIMPEWAGASGRR